MFQGRGSLAGVNNEQRRNHPSVRNTTSRRRHNSYYARNMLLSLEQILRLAQGSYAAHKKISISLVVPFPRFLNPCKEKKRRNLTNITSSSGRLWSDCHTASLQAARHVARNDGTMQELPINISRSFILRETTTTSTSKRNGNS